MKRFLVTGAEGQLGRALVDALGPQVAWAGGRGQLDIRESGEVDRLVRELAPDVIVNAAAYNAVDAAEGDPLAALAVNALGPRHLARAAREAGALMVHVSSDYVFDGSARQPYAEDDCPRPMSAYGISKLAGEQMVAGLLGAHLVVRTSGVLGRGGSRAKGGSFVERILARARSGQPLRVVADQVFAPTWAPDLAKALVSLVDVGARGIVHVANEGECSWHELACAALAAAGEQAPVERISAAELGAPAPRPAYSVLSTALCRELIGSAPRHWRETLVEMVRP